MDVKLLICLPKISMVDAFRAIYRLLPPGGSLHQERSQ